MSHISLEDRIERLDKRVREQEEDIERQSKILRAVADILKQTTSRIDRLEDFTGINEVITFKIEQTGDDMAIKGIAPGASGTFSATPLDSNGNPIPLPAGAQPLQWTSSDPTGAPVTASADGLSATVAVAAGNTETSFLLTVTSPDLPNSPTGSARIPVLQAATPVVVSFSIDQTA